MRAAFGLALVLTTQAASAGPPELHWPVDCVQGQTCYIEDYVDHDPSAAQSDYMCGVKSRDGHRGTDIVLDGFARMDSGVSVRAAADGIVAATRDGVEDKPASLVTLPSLSGVECGNAVRVDHGDGWQTLYCHMRQGSVLVQEGNKVAAGDLLGLVGMSGASNIPHLHFSVLHNGTNIDPFQPALMKDKSCGPGADTLWREAPEYHRAGLYSAGMSTQVPKLKDVKSGAARKQVAHSDEPLVVYGFMYHAETGDVLYLSADGPEGEIFSHSMILRNPKRSQFQAYGRKAPAAGWPTGSYRGMVRLERKGRLIAWRQTDITVTSR